jgi:hypothetical protein
MARTQDTSRNGLNWLRIVSSLLLIPVFNFQMLPTRDRVYMFDYKINLNWALNTLVSTCLRQVPISNLSSVTRNIGRDVCVLPRANTGRSWNGLQLPCSRLSAHRYGRFSVSIQWTSH